MIRCETNLLGVDYWVCNNSNVFVAVLVAVLVVVLVVVFVVVLVQ